MALAALAAGTVIVALARAPAHGVPSAVGVGRGPSSIAIDAATRRVFVLNATDATMSVIDADTGAVVHTVSIGHGPLGNGMVVVDERDKRALVTHGDPSDDTVDILDAKTGRVRRLVHVVYGAGPFAVDDRSGRAFVPNGVLGVLDVRAGVAHMIAPGETGVVATSRPMAVDPRAGRVFLADEKDLTPTVDVFDARNGALVRKVKIGGGFVPGFGGVIAVDERMSRAFVAGAGGAIRVLDTRSARLLRTVSLKEAPDSMVVDDESGLLFVATNNAVAGGRVNILDATTGAVRRVIAEKASIDALALDARHGRVYVLTSAGMQVPDARTGRQLCSRHASTEIADPSLIAVDEKTGRLFIVTPDYPVSVTVSGPWSWMPGWLRQRLSFLPPSRPASVYRLQQPPGVVAVLDGSCSQ